jgi:hypothetical protein
MRFAFFGLILLVGLTGSAANAARKKSEGVQALRIEFGGQKFELIDRHLRVFKRTQVKKEVLLTEPQAAALRSAVVSQIWNLNYRMKQRRSSASVCVPALVLEIPATAEKTKVCFEERMKLSSSIPLIEGLNRLIK